MARFYANENFPLPVVNALRELGHDVATMLQAGKTGQALSDEEVLALARAEGRVLLTLNRKHFIRLHSKDQDHAGMVVCTLDLDFAGQAARIHQAVAADEVLRGHLVRVNRPPA
ncbi:MAG: DUF5615 family PIN-like protein [Planctomycetota bacterium]